MMSAQPEPATHCGWYLRHGNTTTATSKGFSLARRDLYCELQAWQWLERAVEPEQTVCGEHAAVVQAKKVREQRVQFVDGIGEPPQKHSPRAALAHSKGEDNDNEIETEL